MVVHVYICIYIYTHKHTNTHTHTHKHTHAKPIYTCMCARKHPRLYLSLHIMNLCISKHIHAYTSPSTYIHTLTKSTVLTQNNAGIFLQNSLFLAGNVSTLLHIRHIEHTHTKTLSIIIFFHAFLSPCHRSRSCHPCPHFPPSPIWPRPHLCFGLARLPQI